MIQYTPTNDLLFKKVFTSLGNEPILQALIQDITGYQFQSIQVTNPYHIDSYRDNFPEDELYWTEVDIAAVADDGTKIIVEVQVANHAYFADRIYFYTSQTFVESYGKKRYNIGEKNPYGNLRRVLSINLGLFPLFKGDTAFKRTYRIRDDESGQEWPGSRAPIIYYVNLVSQETDVDTNLLDWQAYFLGQGTRPQAPDYIQQAQTISDYSNLSKEEKTMVDRAQKRRDNVAALSDTSLNTGIDIGIDIGVAQERAKNKKQMDHIIQDIQHLLKSGENPEHLADQLELTRYALEELLDADSDSQD